MPMLTYLSMNGITLNDWQCYVILAALIIAVAIVPIVIWKTRKW